MYAEASKQLHIIAGEEEARGPMGKGKSYTTKTTYTN